MNLLKNRYYFFIFFLINVFCKSQVQEDFRYFLDKATTTLYNNPDESVVYTQNLMINDKNPDNQIIYRNLIAQSYAFKGDYLNAIKSSLGKEDAKPEKNTQFHQFYLNYSFADQYQNLGLFDQSRKSIMRVLEKKQFPKNPATQITVGKFFQLQAINFMVSKNYPEALKFLKKSDSVLLQNYQE